MFHVEGRRPVVGGPFEHAVAGGDVAYAGGQGRRSNAQLRKGQVTGMRERFSGRENYNDKSNSFESVREVGRDPGCMLSLIMVPRLSEL